MALIRGGRPLVVTDPTLLVRHDGGRLVMVRDGKVAAAVPLVDISHVALHGPITLTGAALARLLDQGIDVTLHSSAGRFRGLVSSAQPKNVFLLLAQVAAWNQMDKRVALARPLLLGKLAGQRQLLQRHALDRESGPCAEAVARLSVLERQIGEEGDLDALRGLEGAAAAAYFQVFGEMLSGDWTWPGRVRRPPRDPVNALLSFGYVLACSEVARYLLLAGFDLRVGILHGIRYGRESLALDLVEELRAPMVDRFTLRLLNKRQLGESDFEPHEDGAVLLTQEGRRKYLELWEEMLDRKAPRLRNESVTTSERGEGGRRVGREGAAEGGETGPNWRFRIERQVLRLRRFLLDGVEYRPLHRTRKGPAPAPTDGDSDSQRPAGSQDLLDDKGST